MILLRIYYLLRSLIINIYLEPLTIFAGRPGTGKTSLANIITQKILVSPSRCKEIPVARGWNSQKDLIGYQNPLTGSFSSSTSGLYEMLKQLDWEYKKNVFMDSPVAFAILDEANLSPLEHYWSVFYSSTDKNANIDQPIEVNLGEGVILGHANTLRFIATINYDHTTEELSPRVIDRASIIRLPEVKSWEIEKSGNVEPLNITFKDITEIFNLSDFRECKTIDNEEQEDLSEIYSVFKKMSRFPSVRVQKAIKRYLDIAIPVMGGPKALDYCIAQRLLPLINVYGESYRTVLEELLDKVKERVQEESTSIKLLDQIIQKGKGDGGFSSNHFNYFLVD